MEKDQSLLYLSRSDFRRMPTDHIWIYPAKSETWLEFINMECINVECIVHDDAALTWSRHSKKQFYSPVTK